MRRVTFEKGKQRKFFDTIIEASQTVSLRSLQSRGINTPYSTLKNYYNEERTIPEELFIDLCELAGIEPTTFTISYKNTFWGQTKGGKKSKRKQ